MLPERPDKSGSRSKRSGVEYEEEKAWVMFYRRVGHDVALAGEVMTHLGADPEMKRRHLALYLCCKESLRSEKARQARNKRIGLFVQWLCSELLVRPFLAARRGIRGSGQLAAECLPDRTREPAMTRPSRPMRQAPSRQRSSADETSAETSSQSITTTVPGISQAPSHVTAVGKAA